MAFRIYTSSCRVLIDAFCSLSDVNMTASPYTKALTNRGCVLERDVQLGEHSKLELCNLGLLLAGPSSSTLVTVAGFSMAIEVFKGSVWESGSLEHIFNNGSSCNIDKLPGSV